MTLGQNGAARSWAWQTEAACRGTDTTTFYDTDHNWPGETIAKGICRGCPVIAQCRQHAVDAYEEHGIWGGLTPRERDRFRRKQKFVNGARRLTPFRHLEIEPSAGGCG
ncbi:WhiB family transcriptional regulator [Rhodococcus opacus]|nr:WhiB family transcriptional regulator [Rhodococcus opacus]